MRVFFNEYNVRMGPLSYLPLVSGLLRARAETVPAIKARYSFAPFIYAIDSLDAILARYVEPPAIAAFSASMWNERLNLAVAREVKRAHPNSLIVFGGAQVPHQPIAYMEEHGFIDACVRAEGEDAFMEILERLIESRDFSGIPSVTWRARGGAIVENPGERPFSRELNMYPSPYLEGLFDDLVEKGGGDRFQAILETNRGCPFRAPSATGAEGA